MTDETLESKVERLHIIRDEFAELKRLELSLRKEVANMMLGKQIKGDAITKKVGIFIVKAKRVEELRVQDAEELATFADDPDLPGVVVMKPNVTEARMRFVPEDHEIWDSLALIVSKTPKVEIKMAEE